MSLGRLKFTLLLLLLKTEDDEFAKQYIFYMSNSLNNMDLRYLRRKNYYSIEESNSQGQFLCKIT